MEPAKQAPMTGAEWFALVVMTVLVSPVFGACGALIGALATGANSIGMIVGAVASIVFAFFFIKSLRGYRTKKQRIQDEEEEIRQHLLKEIRRAKS